MSRVLAAWCFFPQYMEQGGPCMDPCARGWWLHPLHTGKLTGIRDSHSLEVNTTHPWRCSASFWLLR